MWLRGIILPLLLEGTIIEAQSPILDKLARFLISLKDIFVRKSMVQEVLLFPLGQLVLHDNLDVPLNRRNNTILQIVMIVLVLPFGLSALLGHVVSNSLVFVYVHEIVSKAVILFANR